MKLYKVRGLYRGEMNIFAVDEADARRQYHVAHPGLAGTTMGVEEPSVSGLDDLVTGQMEVQAREAGRA